MGQLGIDPSNGPELVEVVEALQDRASTLVEMAHASRIFYQDYVEFDEKAAKKNLRPVIKEPMKAIRENLSSLPQWQVADIHRVIEETAAALELNMGKIGQPLRVAITGSAASPSIDVTAYLIGKDRVLAGIDKALNYIEKREAETST
jgi:glutamyl-tRNA synthetase